MVDDCFSHRREVTLPPGTTVLAVGTVGANTGSSPVVTHTIPRKPARVQALPLVHHLLVTISSHTKN